MLVIFSYSFHDSVFEWMVLQLSCSLIFENIDVFQDILYALFEIYQKKKTLCLALCGCNTYDLPSRCSYTSNSAA
jgi:hypothetical protein